MTTQEERETLKNVLLYILLLPVFLFSVCACMIIMAIISEVVKMF